MAEAKKAIKKTTKKVAETATKDGDIKETSAAPIQANIEAEKIAEEVTSRQSPVASDEKLETGDKELVTTAQPLAKAGKKSAKALKEAEAKEAKEQRKAGKTVADNSESKSPAVKKARTKLERAGKKLREAYKLVEKDKLYGIKEAVELAIKTSPVKFDATVELHINLGVDPRQADQNVRDNLVLPSGTGKTIRIAVLAEADDAKAALAAGADMAGTDAVLHDIEKGIINFDTLIATPALMAKLGKYARVLGPKGLMPNPKSGTVTTDVVKAVEQAKAGRVEYRVDSTGIVHLGVGKVSFGADKVMTNISAVFVSIKSNKPASIKGNYVKAITLSSTMGPGIKVATSEI